WRLGLGREASVYEVHNLPAPGAAIYEFGALAAEVEGASLIERDTDPAGGGVKKRRLDWVKTRYWLEDLSGPATEGVGNNLGLVYDMKRAAMSLSQVADIFDTDLSTTEIEDAGYEEGTTYWWTTSGLVTYDEDNFYLPSSATDVFGNTTTISYDA